MKSAAQKVQLSVQQALQQLAHPAGVGQVDWEIRKFAEGEQAQLFLARRPQKSPEQPESQEVVIKLYRQTVAMDGEAFRSEIDGLRRLTNILPQHAPDGWCLRSPQLLCASEQPLALIMSSLPGVPLERWLHTHPLDSRQRESLATAILAGLQSVWNQGVLYGDLNLKNILYDAAGRTLSFIDPGLPENFFRCQDVSRQWYPMSRDLAYLLFSVAVRVRSSLSNPAARHRQRELVASIVQKYVATVDSRSSQTQLLEEIHLCLQTHLQALNCGWSPSGIWRQLVKQITHSSLQRTLQQLAVDQHEVPS